MAAGAREREDGFDAPALSLNVTVSVRAAALTMSGLPAADWLRRGEGLPLSSGPRASSPGPAGRGAAAGVYHTPEGSPPGGLPGPGAWVLHRGKRWLLAQLLVVHSAWWVEPRPLAQAGPQGDSLLACGTRQRRRPSRRERARRREAHWTVAASLRLVKASQPLDLGSLWSREALFRWPSQRQ